MDEVKSSDQAAETGPFILQPWYFVLWCLTGLTTQESQKVIHFQRAQIDVLREIIGQDKRLRLNDRQRAKLAEAGKPLGRKKISEFCSLFTPDTILRWHRQLVAKHHTHEENSPGRPPLGEEVIGRVLMLARENPTWGADRIQGELRKLGYHLSDTSVENILKDHGIEPQPKREKSGSSWAEFLKAHWECLAATDFTTVDVWTPSGLKTIYLLFVMELKTRKVQYLGGTEHPNEAWMREAVERATGEDGLLGGDSHPTILIHDRDTKFSEAFTDQLKDKCVQCIKLPPKSPNLNAHMERFMGSYKRELARRMIFFGKQMLDYATEQYLTHYHRERPHQGLDNELIIPLERPPDPEGNIHVEKRLGGMLKSYTRRAA